MHTLKSDPKPTRLAQFCCGFALFMLASVANAQLFSAGEGRVIYGHHHINTADRAAHEKFWIEGLGGSF